MKFLGGFLVGFGVALYRLGGWVYIELQQMFVFSITNRGVAVVMVTFPGFLILAGLVLANKTRRFG
jgi:hypothetical protein